MKTDDRNMLPIKTIPITDSAVAMLAWEVFELCENLKDLLELSSASQHEGSLEAHQAAGSFACGTGYIADHAVS